MKRAFQMFIGILTGYVLSPSALGSPAASPTTTTNMVVGHVIGEQGANHRTWLKIVRTTDAQGNAVLTTNRAFVELATGLNYKDPATRRWLPSREEIDGYPGGAIGQFCRHKVIFANNLNSAGAIDLQMPNGQTLQSGILGLSYYDTASGKSVMIAEIKDCQGQIVGSNQVVYVDAFSGASANVRYKYTKAGLEQDVVLLKQPSPPEAFGLSSVSTVLQVLTEFSSAPQPQITTNAAATPASPIQDESLNFGPMKMIRGKAFLLGTNSTPATVGKQWIMVNGRAVLLESVQLSAVARQLAKLPLVGLANPQPAAGSAGLMAQDSRAAAAAPPMRDSILGVVSSSRLLPARRAPTSGLAQSAIGNRQSPMPQLVRQTPPNQGFVLDYVVVNWQNEPAVLQSGVTYFVSGPVYYGSAVTLQGTAIIKYPNDTTVFIDLGEGASLNCQTSPYQPAIFTAADDDSVGDDVGDAWAGHGGVIQPGGYANPALEFDYGTFSLHDTRISYAQEAMQVTSGANANFSNLQIVNCEVGVDDLWDGGANSQVTLTNCLIVSPDPDHAGNSAFAGGTPNTAFNLHKCTIDGFAELGGTGGDSSDPGSLYADQSAFSNIGDWGSGTLSGDWENGFWNTPSPFDEYGIVVYDSPYVQAGGGSYYLGDSYWTEEYAPTPPPVDYSYESISQSSLGPQQPGEDDQAMGYCYPKLDCVFSSTLVNTPDSSLTIQPGTVVGWCGEGITLASGQQMNFDGTAANACSFVACNTVQEQDLSGDATGVTSSDSTYPYPTVTSTFTHFASVAAQDNISECFFGVDAPNDTITVNAYNCEFRNGYLLNQGGGYYNLSLDLINCLLDDATVWVEATAYAPNNVTLQNCTLHDGGLILYRASGLAYSITVQDCAFDATEVVLSDYTGGGNTAFKNNAYLSGASTLPNDQNDKFVPDGFNWQSGVLGNFYLQDNSPLVDAGDSDANSLGLGISGYGAFTTQTTGMPDSGKVDIGYHYFDDIVQSICPDTPNLPQSWHFCLDSYNTDPDVYGLHLVYTILTEPAHGVLTPASDFGCHGEFIYTPNSGYKGEDSFVYQVSDGLVVSEPLVAAITVGDPNLQAQPLCAMTGVNQSLDLTLHATGLCDQEDSQDYIYNVPSTTDQGGILSATPPNPGTGPNWTYQPPSQTYEGVDSFNYTVSDGVWVSKPATVTIFVVAGPTNVVARCDPFGLGIQLNWSLDPIVQQMEQHSPPLIIQDFKIYRSINPGGTYTLLPASIDGSQTTYFDSDVSAGQTYYYVMTFEYQGDPAKTPPYESPYSIEISAIAQTPQSTDLIPPDATWDVTEWESPYKNDPTNLNSYPINLIHLGLFQAPFGYDAYYDTENPTQPPLVPVDASHLWKEYDDATGQFIYWSNHITLTLTREQISQAVYSIAIDNSYDLYVNGHSIDQEDWYGGGARWSLPFSALNQGNYLQVGTNDISVVIWGDGADGSYFSMLITTDTCGV